MQEKPYALEAALTQRAQARKDAQAALGEQRARLEQRSAEHASLQAAIATLTNRRRADAARRSATGAELARDGAQADASARKHAQLVSEELAMRLAVKAQERAVRHAELVLEAAFVEHAVLDRHHTRFREAARKQAERADDDDADDAQSARSGTPPLR